MRFNRENFFNFIKTPSETEALYSDSTAYYLSLFDLHYPRQTFPSWNWCSFLFGTAWMVYRGMYAYAAILSCLQVALGSAFLFLCSHFSFQHPPLTALYQILVSVALGVYGNALYFRYSANKINRGVVHGAPSLSAATLYLLSVAVCGALSFFILGTPGFLPTNLARVIS